MTVKTNNIFWLGHASFRVTGSRTLYIDPWEVGGPPADLILVTHDHYDHCDPETIKQLCGPKTKIFCDAAAGAKLRSAGITTPIVVMDVGDEIEYLGVLVNTMPAYNVDKDFHPRIKGSLGFIITLDEVTIYHAGDTDFIPEMEALSVDVALLPVSGTYVMTADEAVAAALAIKPKVAIPMHYGKIVGDEQMAFSFADALRGRVKVDIKTQVM